LLSITIQFALTGLGISIVLLIALFSTEVLTDEVLKFIAKRSEHWRLRLIFLRLNVVALLISALSFFLVFVLILLIESNSEMNISGLYRTITVALVSGIIYVIYLSRPIRDLFMSFEKSVIKRIDQKIYARLYNKELAIASNDDPYDDTMTGRLNNLKEKEISLFTSWSDSIVLVFTALGLLLSAYEVSGIILVIYVLLFISIIIAKIRLNHLKEDNQKTNTKTTDSSN